MRFLALAIVLTGLARAKDCPQGFNDNGSGSCISQRGGKLSHNDAFNDCARDNSHLYEIQNAFANYEVQAETGSATQVWLGLTCTSNKTTSCVWDSGRALSAADFTNFYGGAPNGDAGACVLMLVASGMWYSAPCTKTAANYGCQYDSGVKVPHCNGNDMYFRGSCYYVPQTLVRDHYDGQVACWNTCGDYPSIHSAGENSVIRDLASVDNSATYTFLGLTWGTSYTWSDSTSYDFRNFGYENVHMGNCVAMAIVDKEVVANGKWISAQCDPSSDSPETMKVVCKKDLVNNCDVVPTTTLAPTLAPMECVSPYFYSGEGYFYSPGYPRGSGANLCDYTITEDSGNASVTFDELSLDRNSHISLYSGIFDKTPFATINSGNLNSRTFTSSTNVLKVVFDTTGDSSGNYFMAHYGGANVGFLSTTVSPIESTTTAYNQCGGIFRNSNGTIQSPVGSNLNCRYDIPGTSTKTMCIVFDDLNLNDSMNLFLNDYVRSATVNNSNVGEIFCSYSSSQVMTFTAPSLSRKDTPAFVARYSDSWLNTTCNGGDFYTSGTFETTNYPLPYPRLMDCRYILHSNTNITIVFTDFYTESTADYVQVLDDNGNQIQRITGGPYSNITVTSSSRTTTVLFHSDFSYQFRGFKASFYST